MKRIKNNLLCIYLVLNVLLIYLFGFIYFNKIITYEYFSKIYIVLLVTNIIISIGCFIKNKFKFRIYDFFLLLMVIFGIISTIFAIKPEYSFFGFTGRYEGLLSLSYYFSLFTLGSYVSKEKRKYIVYSILLGGFIEAIYGFLQLNEVSFVKVLHHHGDLWVTGFTNNPNFYGTIMLINLAYALGLFVDSEDLKKRVIFSILIIVFLISLLISNTTSCAVGLVFILIYLVIYMIKNKKYNSLLWILILVLNITVVTSQLGKTTLIDDLVKTKNETIEIAKGNINDNYGTKRIKVWKETLKVVPKYIVHGSGIDNYYYAFGKYPLIIGRYYYDKAHNDYLQILVTQGIFSLISYLLFYLSVVLIGFKNKHKKEMYLLLPVLGYLIQAFFNISVIEIAPIFYLGLGLLIDRDDKDNTIYKKYVKRLFDIIISLIMIIILLPVNLIIAILIKIGDRGSVFYKQKRTGKNGKEFNILKFRTIKDKKVTKIGKFLRNTSLDEIPQFINVLKGDMSIIGPRPWITDYYKKFNKKQKGRVEVRPGIIGLAQVNGRNSIDVFKKINYDLEYIDNISFINDLKIVIKSVKVIFVKEDIKDMDKYIDKELKELAKKNKV